MTLKKLLRVTTWVLGAATVLAALLYFSPTLLRGVDAALGVSVRAKVLPALDPAWALFPWLFAAPVLFAAAAVGLWLLGHPERSAKNREAVAPDNPAEGDAVDDTGQQEFAAPVSDDTDAEDRASEADDGAEEDTGIVSTYSQLSRPESDGEALAEARSFVANPDAVADIGAWVAQLVEAAIAPFEQAVSEGKLDVGLRPESARVMYTGLLEQEAARRHAAAVIESGLDRSTITELTGQ